MKQTLPCSSAKGALWGCAAACSHLQEALCPPLRSGPLHEDLGEFPPPHVAHPLLQELHLPTQKQQRPDAADPDTPATAYPAATAGGSPSNATRTARATAAAAAAVAAAASGGGQDEAQGGAAARKDGDEVGKRRAKQARVGDAAVRARRAAARVNLVHQQDLARAVRGGSLAQMFVCGCSCIRAFVFILSRGMREGGMAARG